MAKVLVATDKPFAKVAVDGIRKIVESAGFELALLEKYTSEAELLAAVADVDALIVRSDKVTPAVIDAAKQLKIVVRAGAGYDNIDLEACTKRGIVAMNTVGTVLQAPNSVARNSVFKLMDTSAVSWLKLAKASGWMYIATLVQMRTKNRWQLTGLSL